MDASKFWHAEAAWVLAIRDCKDPAWAFTREWALSIHAAKTSTWALTREWALARDTTVLLNGLMKCKVPSKYCHILGETTAHDIHQN